MSREVGDKKSNEKSKKSKKVNIKFKMNKEFKKCFEKIKKDEA